MAQRPATDPLSLFHPLVREWFEVTFPATTKAQQLGWPAIARGESTLILAPTGSGKTLTAFLWAINRLLFEAVPPTRERCRVLYVSPLKALAADVERNLQAPLGGIARLAASAQVAHIVPAVGVRTGDTPASERARFQRAPSDILITTPESLYLLLTSNAREMLRSVDTVIIDEIHALVPTKRGAHMALSLERLEALSTTPLQRIGLSATQRPLDEVARLLGGAGERPRSARLRPTERRSSQTRPSESEAQAEIHDEFAAVHAAVAYRPVTVVNTGERKPLDLRIEVPVEDMARIRGRRSAPAVGRSVPTSVPDTGASIWSAVHPRLLTLIREHRSTLIFVNNRRTAERLATALNDLAGEPVARAHHGSLARVQRVEIEDALKAGALRSLVATSSLELGIDMGAIDLVVQIESPPSVASGMQRIGRAGHQVGATSRGIIFPKYRGDLISCATVTRAMRDGRIESTRYPRNPLDVLAQQIVAMVAMEDWPVDDLFARIRGAAPYAELAREIFDGVLDMLAGRYPSDEFAELRPRLTWHRASGTLTAREGARRVAVVNGGTIPDRGLYGVYLAGARPGAARVGELDEEMVFESRLGDTFMLGASTWRIEEITHDRVLVTAAPGQPGKMPFWHGDNAGRPLELGQLIGELVRELRQMPTAAALDRLIRAHDLDRQAAENLLQYLADQARAAGTVPDDRTIVIERCRDETGDWRMCLLSPFGTRVHAPWAIAAAAKIRERLDLVVETMWTDDGFVMRFPETEEAPDPRWLVPEPGEAETLVVRQLGATALFAAKFRESAARALLLPKRRPGGRAPLWLTRKRAADLLAVAARFGSFPMLLESYRECLRDVFDMPALVATLQRVATRGVKVVTVDSTTPSPFAASLLFGYVANYIYDGDAPLAERRAQALSIDYAQLRELVGGADLRELLDADVLAALGDHLQGLDTRDRVRSPDALHDLLLRLGDRSREEIAAGTVSDEFAGWLDSLLLSRRIVEVSIAGAVRYIASEHASRYRDGVGVQLPSGLPDEFLQPVEDPLGSLALQFARTHSPFTTEEFAGRYGLTPEAVDATLRPLTASGRLLEGEFRPGGTQREWCSPDVLRRARSRSLAKVRHEVEPVEASTLGRLITTWQGLTRRRRGLDALLDVVEHLQGAAIPASMLERAMLPARVEAYDPADLDALTAAGEVTWIGLEPLGERDGRIALYLTDHVARLRPPVSPTPSVGSAFRRIRQGPAEAGPHMKKDFISSSEPGSHDREKLADRERQIVNYLREHGASFFAPIHTTLGGGFSGETIDALWALVWRGLVTNDTFHALRAFTRPPEDRARRHKPHAMAAALRSRRLSPPAGEGRWSLVSARVVAHTSTTEWTAALAQQLLSRYGIVTREVAALEAIPGGFSAVYPALKLLEESGRIRRGYFVSGVAATQFALPPALEMLRELRAAPDVPEVLHLAATDPANPYGAMLKWPFAEALDRLRQATPTPPHDAGVVGTPGTRVPRWEPRQGSGPEASAKAEAPIARTFARAVGASVVLVNGALAAYLRAGSSQIWVMLPESDPDRSVTGRALAALLADLAEAGGLLIAEINGAPATEHPLAAYLVEAGFVWSALGFQLRRPKKLPGGLPHADTPDPRTG